MYDLDDYLRYCLLLLIPTGSDRMQARSQDLRKGGGGGFFERVRKVQMTLTRIFIVLESESHGISRKHRKFHRFFSPKTGGLQKKKRSSPNLSLILRPKSEIQTFFQTASLHILHNFSTQFPLGGAVFNFQPKIGLKSTKNVQFCILHKPMGGL